jgi:hypothetical protein
MQQSYYFDKLVCGAVLIILTCSWTLGWIAKDEAQTDRVEGFLTADLHYTTFP